MEKEIHGEIIRKCLLLGVSGSTFSTFFYETTEKKKKSDCLYSVNDISI